MKLSICIVNYKSRDELSSCLTSLANNAPNFAYEIIVVDNASSDGSSEAVARDFPKVWLIQNQNNVGFGRACNQAIRQARGEFILLLNPDTVVTANALDRLVLVAQNTTKLGTLSAKLVYPDGTAQPSSYKYFPGIWSELRKFVGLEKIDEAAARSQIRYRVASSWGACLLFRRRIAGRLTQLDPHIFMYSEDIDLCWRFARRGLGNYTTNAATIIHAHNKSGEKKFGEQASLKRLQAFKDTLCYVMRKHQRGPFKVARYKIFTQLVAFNARWRTLIIPLRMRLQGKKLAPEEKTQRLSVHRATAKVFGSAKSGSAGLWIEYSAK